mmetsp:Transcript_729/g.1523  ORF Transcript_729/g.1523 Transcript_729/m.1523 type:complete len:230 (-) Transcript_729:1561-2250(-)
MKSAPQPPPASDEALGVSPSEAEKVKLLGADAAGVEGRTRFIPPCCSRSSSLGVPEKRTDLGGLGVVLFVSWLLLLVWPTVNAPCGLLAGEPILMAVEGGAASFPMCSRPPKANCGMGSDMGWEPTSFASRVTTLLNFSSVDSSVNEKETGCSSSKEESFNPFDFAKTAALCCGDVGLTGGSQVGRDESDGEDARNDPLLSPILSETLVSAPVEGVKNEVGAFLGPLHG